MQNKIAAAVAAAIAAALATLGVSTAVMASGFALPEISTAGMATANAMVANPNEIGAIPYNAAAMGFHDSNIAVGAAMIAPSFSVKTASGDHDSQSADWLSTPMLQAAAKLGDRWRVGFGFNAPFGLETRWQYGTFPALSQSVTRTLPRPLGRVTIPTGNHPTSSKLEVLDLVPSLAYRVNDNLSLGLGLNVYWAKSAQLNSNLGQMSGDGTGLGFNLGALYRLNALSLGLSFNSASTVAIDGNYAPMNNTLVMLGRLKQGQPASVDLNLPWRVQLGARYELTRELAAEFDWSYTGWSEFDRLDVVGDRTGELIFSDTNDWVDTSAYRFGLTWQARPATQLRFGYAYDETGQDSEHFSARVPDSDRQLFSLGVAQDVGNGFSVEASLLYVLANERNVRNAAPYTGSDVNGTSAINGNYEMDATLIGLALVKTF